MSNSFFRKYLSLSLFALMLAGALSACIKNDIPFPKIPQLILSLAVENETAPAEINTEKYSATVFLDEKTDIRKVKVTDFTFTDGAEASPDILGQTIDLSKPIVVSLSKYQTYQWIISASQDITRYFTVDGQIGASDIDAVGKRIIVTIPNTVDLAKVEITSIKLGPADITTLSPDLTVGSVVNLKQPLRINVTCHGITDQWSVYAKVTQQVVFTSEVNAWSQVIWAVGKAPENADNGFRYRLKSDSEWTILPKENINFQGGTFTACIPHLTPLTEYVVQAYSDDAFGQEVTVTTQATQVLPDGSFDQWWLNGAVWCPWSQGGSQFWDTGNTGAATLGQSNVLPSDHTPDGIGKAAMLETRFVGFAGVGKLAAGSIYTGSFKKVDGTNGILDFGRPWNLRPTKLSGFFQYTTAPINYASKEFEYLLNRPDSCHIYVILADWSAPFEIRTNPKNRQLIDFNSPSIIGMGQIICGENTNGYRPFEIKIDYRSYSKVPSYLLITCSASKYGDYFTGGTGATLYVDQFALHYDY